MTAAVKINYVPVTYRDANPTDEGFLYNSWLKSSVYRANKPDSEDIEILRRKLAREPKTRRVNPEEGD